MSRVFYKNYKKRRNSTLKKRAASERNRQLKETYPLRNLKKFVGLVALASRELILKIIGYVDVNWIF